jgi:hypothetical protein
MSAMKMYRPGIVASIKLFIAEEHEYLRAEFRELNPEMESFRYTKEQKKWAINKALEIGVRATARILYLERKTIQRWLKESGTTVRRCPGWVFSWADQRNKRRKKWERIKARRGY